MYTKAALIRLIAGAKELGFQDDVIHWEEKLAELEEKGLDYG
jgi:hypothetical protein